MTREEIATTVRFQKATVEIERILPMGKLIVIILASIIISACCSDYDVVYRDGNFTVIIRSDDHSGATAQCNDGTDSYSQKCSGTCYDRGGVTQ